MGLGPGKRYLINDINAGYDTAFAINVERNLGIKDVDLEQSKATPVSDRSMKYYGEAAEAEAIRVAEVNYQKALSDYNENLNK